MGGSDPCNRDDSQDHRPADQDTPKVPNVSIVSFPAASHRDRSQQGEYRKDDQRSPAPFNAPCQPRCCHAPTTQAATRQVASMRRNRRTSTLNLSRRSGMTAMTLRKGWLRRVVISNPAVQSSRRWRAVSTVVGERRCHPRVGTSRHDYDSSFEPVPPWTEIPTERR